MLIVSKTSVCVFHILFARTPVDNKLRGRPRDAYEGIVENTNKRNITDKEFK